MFGYVRTNPAAMNEEEKQRYRALYCGLCRRLGERHGVAGKMALTYDMTFLCMLLGSLYEPEEETGTLRCAAHPGKPHPYAVSAATDYAADMTIALTYHKCMDDWLDERKHTRRAYAELLHRRYEAVKAQWPEQTGAIEQCMRELSEVERRRDASADAAAGCFGRLMAAVFTWKNDYWHTAMACMGESMGRFIYLADAACDYDEDVKRGGYNPVALMDMQPEDLRVALESVLSPASQVLEKLPLEKDVNILRNILYSGIWQSYNETMQKRKEAQQHGG